MGYDENEMIEDDQTEFLPASFAVATTLKKIPCGQVFLQARDDDHPPHLAIKIDLSGDGRPDSIDVLTLSTWHDRIDPLTIFLNVDDEVVIDLGMKTEIEINPFKGTGAYNWQAKTRLSFVRNQLALMTKVAGGGISRSLTLDTSTWKRLDPGHDRETTVKAWRIVGRWPEQFRSFVTFGVDNPSADR